jgi:hypothetical protein
MDLIFLSHLLATFSHVSYGRTHICNVIKEVTQDVLKTSSTKIPWKMISPRVRSANR